MCPHQNGGIIYVALYKSDETSPVEIAGGKVSVSSDIVENADGTLTVNGFWDEDAFVPARWTDEPVGFPTFEDLDATDRSTLREWTDDLDNRSTDTTFSITRAIVAFVGIVVTVYSVLVYVAFQFDRNQNFVDIELLSILTLGRLRVSPDDERSTYGVKSDSRELDTGGKVVVHKDIIIVSLLGLTVGVLLLSGKIYSLISWGLLQLKKLFD